MKSLKAIIATVILGSSSLALAQPVMIRDHRSDDYGDRSYRDGRENPDQGRMRFRRMPIRLADNLELGMRRPAFLSLERGVQRLRLDADEGHAYIDSIIMMFPDGRSQTISIRQRVTSRSQPLTIDVDGRATGVYIYGSTRGRGSLDVVGLRNRY